MRWVYEPIFVSLNTFRNVSELHLSCGQVLSQFHLLTPHTRSCQAVFSSTLQGHMVQSSPPVTRSRCSSRVSLQRSCTSYRTPHTHTHRHTQTHTHIVHNKWVHRVDQLKIEGGHCGHMFSVSIPCTSSCDCTKESVCNLSSLEVENHQGI